MKIIEDAGLLPRFKQPDFVNPLLIGYFLQ